MRRVIKFKTFFSLRNTKGYTIVELLVVMGIIAILLPLTFGGYNGVRKQKYVQHVANLTQTNIRDTFIDVIATRVESAGTCNDRAPQIKALRVQLGTSESPVSKVAICNNDSGELASPDVVEPNIDLSEGINYKQDVQVSFFNPDFVDPRRHPEEVTEGYLYLIFTSPYGKFYSFYSGGTDAGQADADFRNRDWTRNEDLIYEPGLATNEGYMILFFRDNTGTEHQVYVTDEGNAELH